MYSVLRAYDVAGLSRDNMYCWMLAPKFETMFYRLLSSLSDD